jgi:ferredoxin
MKVTIDHTKCKSHGRCYTFAPEVYERGPKGQAVVKFDHIPDDDLELHRAAETGFMMCPVGAIEIEED